MSSRKEADGAGRWLQQHVTASSGSPAPATVLLLGSVWQARWSHRKLMSALFSFSILSQNSNKIKTAKGQRLHFHEHYGVDLCGASHKYENGRCFFSIL